MKTITKLAKSTLCVGLCIALLALIVLFFDQPRQTVQIHNNGETVTLEGSKNSTHTIELAQADNYYINTAMLDVHIFSADGDEAYAEYRGNFDIDITLEHNQTGDYFMIDASPTLSPKSIGALLGHPDIYIFLPDNELSTVEIKTLGSDFEIENIHAKSLTADCTASNLDVDNCSIESLEHQSFASNSIIKLNDELTSANITITAGSSKVYLPADDFAFEGYSTSLMANTDYHKVFTKKADVKKSGFFDRTTKLYYSDGNAGSTNAEVDTDVLFGNISIKPLNE